MGDTPSLTYLFGTNPENPAADSWGGRFVRAWTRPRRTFTKPPTASTTVEVYSILEFFYRPASPAPPNSTAHLLIDNQQFPGYPTPTGDWRFLFSPKSVKQWTYRVVSTHPALDGQTGAFTSVFPSNNPQPSPAFPNWWTDNPGPALREGLEQGAKTISRHREAFLRDFAARLLRCQSAR